MQGVHDGVPLRSLQDVINEELLSTVQPDLLVNLFSFRGTIDVGVIPGPRWIYSSRCQHFPRFRVLLNPSILWDKAKCCRTNGCAESFLLGSNCCRRPPLPGNPRLASPPLATSQLSDPQSLIQGTRRKIVKLYVQLVLSMNLFSSCWMAGSLHGMAVKSIIFFWWQMRENGPLCN